MGFRLSDFGKESQGIRYLSVLDLTLINSFLIKTQTPAEMCNVIKPNELESSQQRPAQYRSYARTEDMFKLTSVLMESLVRNHPFANANKRTAAMAGYIFLAINGYELTAPEDDMVEILVGISNKEYTVEELEAWLAQWSREYDSTKLCIPDKYIDFFIDVHKDSLKY